VLCWIAITLLMFSTDHRAIQARDMLLPCVTPWPVLTRLTMQDPLDLRSHYVNRANISINQDGARLAFGEAWEGDEINYAVAVFMSVECAMKVRDMMDEVLSKYQVIKSN
jgi:hypothetical protein